MSTRFENDFTPQAESRHSPDFFAEGFTVTTMAADGLAARSLSGEKMLHFQDDQSTELTRPVITIFEKDKPPWKVKSETGWVSPDGEVILLQGRVTIDRMAAPGVRPVHVVTRELRVQPNDEYAETDQPVDLRSRRDWLKSNGMQLWFGKPIRLKFLARVRGYYEPK